MIYGGRDKIIEAVDKYHVDEIFVAMPSVDKKEIAEILNICKETKCKIKTLPGMYQLLNNDIHISDFKDVEIEDLLGREPIKVNLDEIVGYVTNKVIMVTGGGGSIGSELCRQIAAREPKQLITYSIKPNIYGGMICKKMNIPYYCNVQGLGTAFQKKVLAQLVTVLYKNAFKKVKTVFFENKGNAQVFIDKHIIPANKITLLNGAGVNLEQYHYLEYPTNEKLHFLFVGRIMKEKGVDELFEVIQSLQNKNIILDIVGFFEDEYKEKIDELVEKNLAIFHGFQTDVRPYYQNAN